VVWRIGDCRITYIILNIDGERWPINSTLLDGETMLQLRCSGYQSQRHVNAWDNRRFAMEGRSSREVGSIGQSRGQAKRTETYDHEIQGDAHDCRDS